MKNNLRDILEYIIVLVSEFAAKFKLSHQQAFNYLKKFQGVSFIEKHYGIMHTLDFDEAVNSVAMYCRRMGGNL